MIYWYTGQPGHGKTLHAIDHLLKLKEQGRIVYACNIRQFDYEKTGVLEMTPEQFRDWMNFLPDGAVALVDEAYEHKMLPKRPPGAPVPEHVQELAKHRHRGLDFIFVSQSPDKQCDQFVHDLIERHIHVRRMFGSKMVQLREFDKFQANAERATPIQTRRVHLLRGKRSVGTYQSTEMDTTEKRIPWYWWAFGLGIPLGALALFYVFGGMQSRLVGDKARAPEVQLQDTGPQVAHEGNGAFATVAEVRVPMSAEEYQAQFQPRVPSQPWSAPAYDSKLSLTSEPPRIFCMQGAPGETVDGQWRANGSCSCLTEQGTRYLLEHQACALIASAGQYEPYFDERIGQMRTDGLSQQAQLVDDLRQSREFGTSVSGSAGSVPVLDLPPEFGTITRPMP